MALGNGCAVGLALLLGLTACSSTSTPPGSSGAATTSQPAAPVPSPTPPTFRPAAVALRASLVQVVTRPGPGDAWREECSGNKVVVDGAGYVITARHCFDGHLDRSKLFPSLTSRSLSPRVPDLYRSYDITRGLGEQVGIRTTGRGGVDAGSTARVTRVVVRYFPDVALLSVPRSSRRYRDVPSLPYPSEVQGGPRGVRTQAFGLPSASPGKVVAGRGTYLGRVHDPGDPARILDLVGLHVRSPQRDVCNYGASGSLAVLAPDGHPTGPLARRFNFVNRAGTNGTDDPLVDRPARRIIAAQLGHRLTGYTTICGYGVVTRAVLDSLVGKAR